MLKAPEGIDFSAQFSGLDIASRKSVITAVSGGSDSTGLLLSLKGHIGKVAPRTRLVAVTVDHALRPGSANEAAEVGKLCARLGIVHHIATWTGAKPSTGIPAAAREARHDLLARVARNEGTDLVLTGHTANDQVETVLMRQSRSKGELSTRGLAGIAPATLFQGDVWFVRPLIKTRREVLRQFLNQRGISWIDDPTNVDPRFERSRLRAAISNGDGNSTFETALQRSMEIALWRERLAGEAALLISAYADQPRPGLFRLDAGIFGVREKHAVLYALRILLAVAGGTPHLPDEARIKALQAQLATGQALRAVVSRALVDQRKSGTFILREERNVPKADTVRAGAIWDGRYLISSAHVPGVSAPKPRDSVSLGDIADSLVQKAYASLPPQNIYAIPVLAPFARYLPSFDIVPAQAVARLLGAPTIPEPPFREHIEGKA